MSEYALAVTIHDPEERLAKIFNPHIPEIAELYPVKTAAVTASTSDRTVDGLTDAGFTVIVTPNGQVGESRRIALRNVLEIPTTSWFHYADLDRLIHWQLSYPDELRKILSRTPDLVSEYVGLGRTQRAWKTHPDIMVRTEELTNTGFRKFTGLMAYFDLTAGSCLFSRRVGEMLISKSSEPTNATDLEWPSLVISELGINPTCWQTEGLEFETPDCYPEEIRQAGGLSNWMEAVYNNPEAWLSRIKLSYDSLSALARVLN